MRLGSIVLASSLLGVPRALGGGAFGAPRPVRVEVPACSAGLLGFAAALERALGATAFRLARHRSSPAMVVDVMHVASVRDALGRAVEAITLAVTEGRRRRRILLQATPGGRDAAARELVARLSPGDC